MGFAHEKPRRMAVVTESTFGGGPSTDYDTDAVAIWPLDIDTSSVVQQVAENENITPRPAPYHDDVLGPKSGSTFTFGQYLTAKGTNAAEDSAAATTELAENIRCWLGGRRLGYCSGAVSHSGADLTLDTGQGGNWNQGDWLFLDPDGSGTGAFYEVQSVSTDTLTLDRAIVGTVDTDGTAHAVIACYLDQDALTKNTDGNYITRAFLIEGMDSEDIADLRGVKLQGELAGFSAGEQPRVNWTGLVTTFPDPEDQTQEVITDTPEGQPPLVVSAGSHTSCWLADVGSSLAAVKSFSFEPRIGITWEAQTGPCGTEGVHGYMAQGWRDVGLSMQVQFDAIYWTDFRARTMKHALFQVGNTPTDAIGVYFPRLGYAENPQRVEGPAMTTAMSLNMRGYERTASAGSLTGDDLECWRSPAILLFVA